MSQGQRATFQRLRGVLPSGVEGVLACVDRCVGAGDGTAGKGGDPFDVDLEATVARAEAALFIDALVVAIDLGATGVHTGIGLTSPVNRYTGTKATTFVVFIVGSAVLQAFNS